MTDTNQQSVLHELNEVHGNNLNRQKILTSCVDFIAQHLLRDINILSGKKARSLPDRGIVKDGQPPRHAFNRTVLGAHPSLCTRCSYPKREIRQ